LDSKALLTKLHDRLNRVVLAAGGGHANMTFIASVLDLEERTWTTFNAAHPPAYLYRVGQQEETELKRFKAVQGLQVPALGTPGAKALSFQVQQLQPGDVLLFYTDGLMEARVSDGQKMSKPTLLRSLSPVLEKARGQGSIGGVAEASRLILGAAVEFQGGLQANRADDITVVVATLPLVTSGTPGVEDAAA
jgi:sigma-B regulation protein RsbU (phosphoserine phosphatase)